MTFNSGSDNIKNNKFIGSSGTTNSESEARVPVPLGGTLNHLTVVLTSTSSTKTWTFTVFKDGISTNLICTVSPSTTVCLDPVNTVSVLPGDTVSIKTTTSNGGFNTKAAISLLLTP